MMTTPFRATVTCLMLMLGGGVSAISMAQSGPVPLSQMDLKGSDAGKKLATAMATLATSPKDVTALLNAGEAALQLDDPRSAVGFFGRADSVSPNNGRVKAGLGRSMLAMGQTGDGLRLMEEAARLNYSDVGLLVDRGLARDLTGNQAGAQRDYQEALRLDPQNIVAERRYAVSLGITGQAADAEKMLEPLLRKQDRSAWRDQAFILAMNGRTKEALDITNIVMPRTLAEAIKPYMERMAMLTPGQKAAAVHRGQFPDGLVNVRVASTAVPAQAPAAAPAPVQVATADTKKNRKKREKPTKVASSEVRTASSAVKSAAAGVTPASVQPVTARVPTAAAETRVAVVTPSAPLSSSPPLASVAQKPQAVVAEPAKAEAAPARTAVEGAAPAPSNVAPYGAAATRPVQGPPADALAQPSQTSRVVQAASVPSTATATAAPSAAVETSVTEPAESPRSLADIMADIEIPAAERQHDVVPVSMAELAKIQEQQRQERLQQAAEEKARKAAEAKEAARRKAEAEARAKAEAEKKRLADNPARYWVQIGAGSDKGAMAFTLRNMKKKHSAIAKYDGWSADYGRTRRLIVGPFPNLTKAKAVEAEMKKAGSDAFVWRSDAGEEVDKVGN